MPDCTRCGTQLTAGASGLRELLGLVRDGGHECVDCGTLLCEKCHHRRTVEPAGDAFGRCPTCDGPLVSR